MLDLDAGIAGLALPEDAKHGMLHLDDEIAGLIEAADTAADQAGAHSVKPEPAASVPGEGSFADTKLATTLLAFCCGCGDCIVSAVLCCAVLCCL